MNKTTLTTASQRAVCRAIEEMAFLSAVPATTKQPIPGSQWSWVKVVEPCPGMVVLSMTALLSEQICRGMLGEAAVPTSAEIADSQAELVNVIAGQIISGLQDPSASLCLGIPRTGRGAPNVAEEGWFALHFHVGEDQGLSVWLKGPILQLSQASTQTGLDQATLDSIDVPKATSPAQPIARGTSGRMATATDPTLDTPSNDTWRVIDPASVPKGIEPGIPEIVGHFRILRRIGEGGMGVVYEAQHETLKRTVALKVMRPEVCQDEKFVSRFLREARVVAGIDHPNVVTVYDAGQENGVLYMALRFVPGGDLSSLIRREGTIEASAGLTLIAQCLLGLEAIRANGLIHRDIKPANILLERDGTPRLADLGLARSTKPDEDHSQVGGAQGTPSFMSPEQARGSSDLDIRTDIYSLGTTLYTLLTGAPPFHCDSAYETVAQVLYTPPVPLSDKLPKVALQLEKIVMKSIEKKAEDRYQTPLEFLAAIEEELTRCGAHLKKRSGLLSVSGEYTYSSKTAISPTSSWIGRWFRSGRKR